MSGSPWESGAPGPVDLINAGDPAWARFVADHPDATCFHQPAWLATLTEAYGFRGLVAVQRNGAGTVLAGLPLVEVRHPIRARRWSCLPFTDECAPLVGPHGSLPALLLGVEALRRAREIADLEVRADVEVADAQSRQVAVTHTLTLDGGSGD